MFFKVLRDIAKPQWFEIISHIKRSTGLSVAELAKALGMSYMGVKQHCVELHKRGYLDTWRRPKAVGRPEKAYRLTNKADPLFAEVGNDFALTLLRTVGQTYGEAAAEKLLFGYFQERLVNYEKKIKGETLNERAASFSRIREMEGCLSSCENGPNGELRIVEYHSPFGEIIEEYPMILRMEEQMFERLLGVSVRRDEERASGLLRFVFTFK